MNLKPTLLSIATAAALVATGASHAATNVGEMPEYGSSVAPNRAVAVAAPIAPAVRVATPSGKAADYPTVARAQAAPTSATATSAAGASTAVLPSLYVN